eukprot:jgi/Tetstr1/458431/TSEL_044866.t1
MVNLFPLAPCHLIFWGLGKDFWRNFVTVLRHVGFRAMKQEHRRQALVLIPINFGRGLRPSFAVSKKSKGLPPLGVGVGVGVTAFPFMTARSGKVTVRSGWVMEDCWHHMKTFSLLTAGPLFKEARVKAIMTEKELASPAVMRSVSQLAMLAFGHPLAELRMEVLMGFLKAGAKRVLPKNVCETMMRDLLFAQQINRLKAHRLYREPNKKKPIRLVGSASAAWEDAVDFKHHLEKLLDDVRHVEASPRRRPTPYTTTEELESEEELPRNLLAEREDAKYTTMVARAQHFYLATPPPPPGPDSDDSRASARLIRAVMCTTVRAIRKVDVLMASAHLSSAKAAGLGVDAGELLVAGIHARSQDVRAKCKCKLLVAGIHARSQDGAGLGVCRRQSCKAMGTVRDTKSG